MEYEGIEQEILLEPENAIVGAVYSVNGKTGDVVLTTSDLENDSDYQTGDEVDAAIATAIAGKQDTLTAGNNIQISDENVISATDTTYSAGNGLNLSSENAFSVDTTVVATQQNLATEVQNRENADNALQAQIDGISASSDVVDIVGTYADLQNYDTSKLKDNDIIKVLQDETQNDATTYYRWSTTTETFTLIGQEGPYYTKAAADAQFVPQTRTVNGKALSSNITLNASDVSALGTSDVVQTTGSSTSQVMSQDATTQALGTKLNITDYVVDDELKNSTNPVQNGVLYGLLGNMPTDFFSGNATTEQTGTEAQFTNALKISDIELQGDTFQQTYSGKNLLRTMASASTTTGGVTFTVNADGTITANGTATTGINYYPAGDANSYSIPAGTYTLSDGLTNPTSTTYFTYIDGTGTPNFWWNTSDGRITQTVPEGGTIRPRIVIREGQTLNNVVFKLQLESGPSQTSFEPYVGGTASPNPDYPQDVQVVTGEQTVDVHGKNGSTATAYEPYQGQDYTVNLGSIELAKIGNYQDYIYKSGDDWYVHKETGKDNLPTSGYTLWATDTSACIFYQNYTPTGALISYNQPSGYIAYLPTRQQIGNVTEFNDYTTAVKYMFAMKTQTAGIVIKNKDCADTTALNTWLLSNPLTLYYILDTATDTQITDSTLVGQLNALYNAKMLAGQTNFAVSAVSPNLPAILDITVFNANAQGLIASIRGN